MADKNELPVLAELQGLASLEGPRPARSPSCDVIMCSDVLEIA